MIGDVLGDVVGSALEASDAETYELCRAEEKRQAQTIRLIPSENYVSVRVISNPSDENAEKVLGEVRELTRKFPAPGISA